MTNDTAAGSAFALREGIAWPDGERQPSGAGHGPQPSPAAWLAPSGQPGGTPGECPVVPVVSYATSMTFLYPMLSCHALSI